MKQRKLVIGLLIMLAVLASGFTYAFWAGSVGAPEEGDDSVEVNIGQGNAVTTSFNLGAAQVSAGTTLVPTGMANDAGEVTSFTVSFLVAWNNDALDGASLDGSTTTGDLDFDFDVTVLTAGDVEIVDQDVLDLVNVIANPANATSITLGAAGITISVTITLDEPANVDDYEAIALGSVVIDFTFNVSNIVTQ
jgi:hypothetical protein